MVYYSYKGLWPYLVLFTIDVFQTAVTIWGSVIQFGGSKYDYFECMIEMPLALNFQLVALIMGYIYIVRMIFTLVHFKYGPLIYEALRNKCPCFRGLVERNSMSEKFPVYIYQTYLQLMPLDPAIDKDPLLVKEE